MPEECNPAEIGMAHLKLHRKFSNSGRARLDNNNKQFK